MKKKSVRDVALKGRRVLVRADFNVPLDDKLNVTDDLRIRQASPTIRHIADAGGRVVLMSHLGRPSGKPAALADASPPSAENAKFSLRPAADRLSKLLGKPVRFATDCAGPASRDVVGGLRDGEVGLLENLRFHDAETVIDKAKKNPDGKLTAAQDEDRRKFAAGLAAHADVYVNDAFGTCHRRHVSMYDVPALLGAGKRVLGFLVEKELQYLGRALESPARPFVAILGGAKVSDKIGVIRSLLATVDHILIGGAMTYTFWAARGDAVGKSLCERDKLELAKELMAQAGAKLHLPVDSVAAGELKAGAATRVIEGALPADQMGLDIGPRTLSEFAKIIGGAKTVLWNGPVGAFETPPFEAGTFAVARMIAEATKGGAVSIIGGGDSAAAVDQAGLAPAMTHISTGGGASLEFLEKRRFATIDILDDA